MVNRLSLSVCSLLLRTSMENLARHYAMQYKAANALYGTDRHDECIAMYEDMVLADDLP